MKKYFITGTDTDIGKTFVSCVLCKCIAQKGYKVGYYKPLQSGAYLENGILKAPDIEFIKKYISIPCGYSYLLEGEVSPYLAAKLAKKEININKIQNDIDNFCKNLDIAIIEGAGGLYCPAANNMTYADIIKQLNIPLIIVTTADLGRLNHVLMTVECARFKGIDIKGIIINKIQSKPSLSQKHFIEELKNFCDVNILCTIEDGFNLAKNCSLDINL